MTEDKQPESGVVDEDVTDASGLVTPDEYPAWVPGDPYLDQAAERNFDGVSIRGYHYEDLDVTLPPVRDYLVVAYHRGVADMRRRFEGKWSRESLGPGDVTLLTRAVETRWTWREPIDVVHVHLTQDLVRSVCRQMYERDPDDVLVRDELKANDEAVYRTSMLMAQEASGGEAGDSLLVDTLSTQMAVHLLRHHAELRFREFEPPRGMSEQMVALVRDYVEQHLHESMSLQDLASVLNMSQYHFARRFKEATGSTPHSFIVTSRLERAQRLLTAGNTLTLAEIASTCGFSDQSHMTRIFRQRVSTTPGRFRQSRRH